MLTKPDGRGVGRMTQFFVLITFHLLSPWKSYMSITVSGIIRTLIQKPDILKDKLPFVFANYVCVVLELSATFSLLV